MSAEGKLKAMGLDAPGDTEAIGELRLVQKGRGTRPPLGQGTALAGRQFATGKVGRDVTVEQAYEHAKLVGLGLLSAAKVAAGSLDKVGW